MFCNEGWAMELGGGFVIGVGNGVRWGFCHGDGCAME